MQIDLCWLRFCVYFSSFFSECGHFDVVILKFVSLVFSNIFHINKMNSISNWSSEVAMMRSDYDVICLFRESILVLSKIFVLKLFSCHLSELQIVRFGIMHFDDYAGKTVRTVQTHGLMAGQWTRKSCHSTRSVSLMSFTILFTTFYTIGLCFSCAFVWSWICREHTHTYTYLYIQ